MDVLIMVIFITVAIIAIGFPLFMVVCGILGWEPEIILGLRSPRTKREKLKKVRMDISHLREDEERVEQELIDEQGGNGPHRKQARIPTED
jgi:hypothetical protein